MTDNEIIKALGYCLDAVDEGDTKTFDFLSEVISLINRQKAENEKMRLDTECLVAQIKEDYMQIVVLSRKLKTAKSKAIKEFAERLKELKIRPEFPWDDYYVNEGTIDNLVKEMTEVV